MYQISLELILRLNELFTYVPGSITSLIRTQARNKIIGGASNSLHTQGLAADLVFSSVAELFQAAHKSVDIGFNGVEVDLVNNHLHVDLRKTRWHVVQARVDQKTVTVALSEYMSHSI